MKGHHAGILCAAALLAAALMTAGCGKKENVPPPQEVYGIVDMETLVKAHPGYVSYFKLETEYKGLLAQYQAERKRLTMAAAVKEKVARSLHSEAAEKARQEEYKRRIKIKEESLNSRLRSLYEEIEGRHRGSAPVLSGDDAAVNREIANLQMKLKVLQASGGEKSDAEARLAELLNRRFSESSHQGWTEEEEKEMRGAKAAASAELDAYAEEAAEEIRKRPETAAAAGPALPDPEIWNQEWETRLKAKQQEMAEAKEKIMKDIREKAAYAAEKNHLVMIFSSYRANVTAVDVTGDIVNELAQMK